MRPDSRSLLPVCPDHRINGTVRHNKCQRDFGALCIIPYRSHTRIYYHWVTANHFFELSWADLEPKTTSITEIKLALLFGDQVNIPFVFDHVLQAVHNDQISLVVQVPDVSCFVPIRAMHAFACPLFITLVPTSLDLSVKQTCQRNGGETHSMMVGVDTTISPG